MLLKNEKGLSLVELMISVGLGGFVAVMAMSTLVRLSNQSTTFVQTMSSDIEQMRAVALVNSIFGQAVELRVHGNLNLNTYTSLSEGRIREYDSNAYWAKKPATQTLAVFWRESAHSTVAAPGALSTVFLPTAIYFQPPTQTTFGVLYVNLGAGASLMPSRQDFIVENLTRVRVMNIMGYQVDPGAPVANPPVTGFDLELTVRHFLDGQAETLKQRTYCPDDLAALGTCTNTRPHKDVASVYHVIVRNNIVGVSMSGNSGARLYDQLHFFAPVLPGGL